MRKNIAKGMVFTALFAALSAASGFLSFPLPGTPIPIVLQNMMTVLSGLILGPGLGTASTAFFVTAGLLGLPVFNGGTGGLAKLMGPTGGFIIGYALASLTAGLVAGKPRTGRDIRLVRIILASLPAYVVMYIPGVIHFMRSLDKTFGETMAMCVLPYLPGDALKMVLGVLIARPLRRTVAQMVFGDEEGDFKEDV